MLKLAKEIVKRVRTKNIEAARRRSRQGRTLKCESLERREVFAVSVGVVDGHTLYIQGTDGADHVDVKWLKNGNGPYDDQIGVYENGKLIHSHNMYYDDFLDPSIKLSAFGDIEFHGGKGDDVFRVVGETPREVRRYFDDNNQFIWNQVEVTAYGEDGDDTLIGGDMRDKLFGGKGRDTLVGNTSDERGDYLDGGDGDDSIYGDNYNSVPSYHAGIDSYRIQITQFDTIQGGDGNDKIYAGYGGGSVAGGLGDDYILGYSGGEIWGDMDPEEAAKRPWYVKFGGNDIIEARGSFKVIGGAGNDRITGDGNGFKQELYGDGVDPNSTIEVGDDVIYGDGLNDSPVEGHKDVIYGGGGNDLLVGGWGVDEVHGGVGNDTICDHAMKSLVVASSSSETSPDAPGLIA